MQVLLIVFVLLVRTLYAEDTAPRVPWQTCDLDLLPDDLHEFLPKQCQNLSPEEYEAALRESGRFEEFMKFLNQYEENGDEEFLAGQKPIPDKQWDMREEIYDAVDWQTCYNLDSYFAFSDCLENKRRDMLSMLGKVAG